MLFKALPAAITAEHEEVLHFIEYHRLMGIGLVNKDIHLLAAARLTSVPLWTDNGNLREAAARLGIGYRGG